MTHEIEFKIDSWTPATLPQARLGEYLIEVAKLYGEPASVHFEKLRKGSAILVSRIDGPAVPKVERRLLELRTNQAAAEVVAIYTKIDGMLANDNAVGLVRGLEPNAVLNFPGRTRPRPIEYAAIREEGFLEGEIVRIGGRDKTVHLTLQSGEDAITAIETDRTMARQLAPHIFGPPVRLQGLGSWRRSGDGAWSLDRFLVSGFKVFDEASLADTVGALRSLGSSTWGSLPDPVASLLDARTGKRGAKR